MRVTFGSTTSQIMGTITVGDGGGTSTLSYCTSNRTMTPNRALWTNKDHELYKGLAVRNNKSDQVEEYC